MVEPAQQFVQMLRNGRQRRPAHGRDTESLKAARGALNRPSSINRWTESMEALAVACYVHARFGGGAFFL